MWKPENAEVGGVQQQVKSVGVQQQVKKDDAFRFRTVHLDLLPPNCREEEISRAVEAKIQVRRNITV